MNTLLTITCKRGYETYGRIFVKEMLANGLELSSEINTRVINSNEIHHVWQLSSELEESEVCDIVDLNLGDADRRLWPTVWQGKDYTVTLG